MTTVTLITGEQVDSASEAYRLECEARELLRGRSTQDRREYLAIVERKRGTQAADALKAAIQKLWEESKR